MIKTTLARIGAALAVMITAGCVSLGALEDIYASERYDARELNGYVRRVDERSRRIEIESGRGTRDVYYDSRTRVVENGRERRVERALDRGDRVSVRVRRDRGGYAYAETIYVTRNARDDRYGRDDRDGRRRVVTGRVERVDRQRGGFYVDQDNGPDLWVFVPRELRDSRRDRFYRLDRGDRVVVEGRFVDRDRFQADRIR